MIVVELQNVTKRYGSVLAVDHVSLAVRHGEFFSILGPSGCGKTTVLRLIAGFEHPEIGTIVLKGLPTAGIPPHQRDVNTVFQSYALFPHMTVQENIAFGLKMKGESRQTIHQKVEEALRLVQLSGYHDRKPRQLSGGQMQRVALARALVNRPTVLLLDEPLGALDLKLRKEMQTELKRLQRQLNLTFIYVTHDQDEALTLSDRLAVMRNGRFEQIGTPAEIYEQPGTRFVAEFIGESNVFDGRIIALNGGQATFQTRAGLTFSIRQPDLRETLAPALLVIRPEKIAIDRASPNGARNLLTGTIAETAYLGTMTKYYVETAGGLVTVLTQNVASPQTTIPLRAGDAVVLHWSPESGIIVKTSDE